MFRHSVTQPEYKRCTMKKINLVKLLLLLVLIVSIAVSMCSCGGKKESSKNEATGGNEAAEEAGETAEEMTLEQYFAENPQDLQDIKDSVNEDENMQEALKYMDFDVYAEDNTLYYDYQFKETYPEAQTDTMKDSLADTLDGMDSSISSTIGLIESGFKVSDVTIHITYKNGDGSVLAEKDYTK